MSSNRTSETWTRQAPLDGVSGKKTTECWEYRGEKYSIDVTVGKKLDVLSLKGTSLGEIRKYAGFLTTTARTLYAERSARNILEECPCCDHPASHADEAMRVFSVTYVRCARCGHVFVREQPAKAVLDQLFSESAGHSAAYTEVDPAVQEIRIGQIAEPKVRWVLEQYQSRHARAPQGLVDVGAGGGHFIEAARRNGIDAIGYEKSEPSRRFARSVFGIELDASDFASSKGRSADVITFWGLLEYVSSPRQLLAAARRRLNPDTGMLIVEVPRFGCMGTAVQRVEGSVIARHMDPTSHVNCFTDASLCTALVAEGFKPVAAWYFGMDAYELLVQVALRLGDETALGRLLPALQAIQEAADAGRQCDDLIVAAVPAKRSVHAEEQS